METNSNSMRFYTDLRGSSETQENTKCNICGEEFEQPLLAEIASDYYKEEYYACPRCLSKVKETKQREKVEVEAHEIEEEAAETEPEFKTSRVEDTSGCPHYLGYLKKRPKNSSVPEDCFTCSKMIECM